MKTKRQIQLFVLALLSLASPARAASVTSSPAAPAIGAEDIANYGAVTGIDKWFYENSGAGAAKGQTFTTGNAAVLLKAITYQIVASEGAAPTKTYVIRVGTVAGAPLTFTQIAGETATQTVAWAAGDYVTWTFATPVLLQSHTAYGIDVGMTGSTSSWTTGIPYLNTTANEYTGGAMYNSGTLGIGTTSISLVMADRIFHIRLDKPITPEFSLVATSPADEAVDVLASDPLSVTFSRYLARGTGTITVRNLTDSTDTAIPIGDPRISVFENLLTIDPGSALVYGKSYAVRIDPGALVSDTAVSFDGIANDTTWNFSTAASDPLLDAIAKLKSHINGSLILSAEQISANKLTIDAEKSRFATSAGAIAAAFDLVTTYDTVLGPLFVARSLPARSAVTNDLHWTLYTVMQDLMDVTYTAANITDNQSLLNGFKFGSSSAFPGPCVPPADPDQTHTATLSASYLDTAGRTTQGDGPATFARKPTGTYLAPGSIATVTVPAALVNAGYKIRVGAHSWDFSGRTNIKRLERSSLVYDITALETRIASPLGGGIYIEVPFLANAGVVSVQIKNAVRSPYFSKKSFHTTTPEQWLTERASPAPWADFQTDKFMMQVPTSWISAMPDPTQLMADWDASMDACTDLMGFPRLRGKESFYLQVDKELRASVFAPGYPAVNVGGFSSTATYGGYNTHYLVRGPQSGGNAHVEFHEQGHGFFFPKLAGETESTVNLLFVQVLQQKFVFSLDEAFRASLGYVNTYQTLDTTAIAWMTVFNFSPREVPMNTSEKAYQLKGHAKFADIARLFGWDKLNNFWQTYAEESSSDTATDSMLLRLSTSVGKDIRPLFHFWGIYPANPATLSNAIAAAGLTPSLEIYNALLHYKTLVPVNNAAFQSFAFSWWGRQPTMAGAWEEREHARQWDTTPLYSAGDQQRSQATNPGEIYNENSANDIKNRVQELINLYFPTGAPADTTPPAVLTLSPSDDAVETSVGANFAVTFTKPVVVGTGNITLKNLTDATQSTIAITDASQVSVSGTVLTINPAANLLASKQYAIRIGATAIDDVAGNSFAGLTNDTAWCFTTQSANSGLFTWDGTDNTWTSAHWNAGAGLVSGPVGDSSHNSAAINGGTVTFAASDTFGNALTMASPVITVNSGATLASGGFFNTLWDFTLNGGTLLANGGANALSGAFALKGTVTVGGHVAAAISAGSGSFNTVSLGSGTGGDTTFNVADVTVSSAPDLTLSTVLNDNAGVASGLTKTGSGTLTLTGSNTYSGPTTISAGTLMIGGAGQLGGGAYAGAIANNASFNYASLANQTLSGVISGTGELTKTGTGTLILNGANTCTGGITVDAGTLRVNGTLLASAGVTVNSGGVLSGTGAVARVTVASGGTLAPGLAVTTGALCTSNLTVQAGGALTLRVGASNDAVKVTGDLVLNGTVTLVSSGGTVNSGTPLFTYSGSFSGAPTLVAPSGYVAALDATEPGVLRVMLTATLPFRETFEDTPAGMAHVPGPVDGQRGWQAEPAQSATVQTGYVYAGQKTVALTNGTVKHSLTGVGSINVWFDFIIQPQMNPDDSPFALEQKSSVAMYLNSAGKIVVQNGAEWRTCDTFTAASNEWVRFTVKLNYAARKWDLFASRTSPGSTAVRVARDLDFVTGSTNVLVNAFSVKTEGDTPAYFDNLSVTDEAVSGRPGHVDWGTLLQVR